MTAPSAPRHVISEQEYLDGERHSELRHEYIDGQVYAMTGASDRHGLILNALAYSMTPTVRRKGCQLLTSGMKLRVEIGGKTCFYYLDLLLSCDPGDREPYFRRSLYRRGVVGIDRAHRPARKAAGLPGAVQPAGVSAGRAGGAGRGAVPPRQ